MIETLNYSAGMPDISGCIRTTPEDFQVIEELSFAPEGSGEHVFLRVRKRNTNTAYVAQRLADVAGVSPAAVGYAGLKDRYAVAEQWFSVHLPGKAEPDWSACGNDGFTIQEHQRHSRKLRRGALSGNTFCIVIRNLRGDRAELDGRLRRAVAEGIPNYFGEQRFGRGNSNLACAEAMFSGRKRIKSHHRRGLYLSAARSQIFNHVLSQRVGKGSWNQPLEGDVMMLEGSHSVFAVDAVDDTIRRRVTVLDIHPTGPLWGDGEPYSRGEVLAIEKAVAARFPVLCAGLEKARLEQARRALRLRLMEASLEAVAADAAAVRFRLPPGSYATAVLRELVNVSAGKVKETTNVF